MGKPTAFQSVGSLLEALAHAMTKVIVKRLICFYPLTKYQGSRDLICKKPRGKSLQFNLDFLELFRIAAAEDKMFLLFCTYNKCVCYLIKKKTSIYHILLSLVNKYIGYLLQ